MSKLPQFLVDRIYLQYGEEANEIIEGFTNKPVTFRINRLKTTLDEVEYSLKSKNIIFEKVSWYSDAFIVKNKKEEDIRLLDIYKDGKIYLQSLSSMLPVLFLNPKEGESILDMAAAPGGKTTQIASIMNDKVLITACEKNKIRMERLKYNLEKQGVRKVTVLSSDAGDLDDFFSFDKILLDAPCSGSGTLHKEDNLGYFKEELIEKTKKIQKKLLEKAVTILKPGAEMIYSTCSVLTEENEEQIENLLQRNLVEIVPLDISLLEEVPLLPTKIEGTIIVSPTSLYEGFFVCKIRKK